MKRYSHTSYIYDKNSMKPKIVFFGTPEFARDILRDIHEEFEVVGVVTSPDAPVGRKRVITPTPVKEFALEKEYDVFTPAKLKKNPEFLETLQKFQPDLMVVVAYGLIIPKSYLDAFPGKWINIHPSILPQYRGPAPMHAPLLNGDSRTGTSIMIMDHKMDHGPILAQALIPIEEDTMFTELSDQLRELSSDLLLTVTRGYLDGSVTPVEQEHELATFTKYIHRNDGLIDWSRPALEIYNQYRAFHVWPESASWFEKNGRKEKVKFEKMLLTTEAAPFDTTPGQIVWREKRMFVVCGQNTMLEILALKPAGKNSLSAKEFLNGYKDVTFFLSETSKPLQ
jgi:methionyl-tRNA formyltransferase